MTHLLITLCAGSIAMLGYIYVGYPLMIALLAKRFGRQRPRAFDSQRVSVVLSVHNEARNIGRKLDNLLRLEHADCLTEILVGSDGSTDETPSLVAVYPDSRVRLIAFAERRGKPAVLNALVPLCRGDIVLFVDARQEFDSAFLTELLANFADPAVGVVSGELVLRSATSRTTAAEGIGFYWKYEKFLRRAEGQFRGVPGATGACYAIRKDLFRPIAETTILDDVAIPLSIIEQGAVCLFEPRAVAYDDPSQSTRQESLRKRRTIAGAAQLIQLYPRWLNPRHNPLWFEYVSHKLLRLTSPVWLLLTLAANLALLHLAAFQVLLSLQLAFYVTALCGWAMQKTGRKSTLFGASLMFCALNWTTAEALWDALRSRYQITWTKAA